jgi:tripartite-type tricarboxylate transporter receptor subunit TctC
MHRTAAFASTDQATTRAIDPRRIVLKIKQREKREDGMMIGVRTASLRVALGLGMAAAVTSVAAEPASYPNRPVRVVVTFAPGGNADVLARGVAARLTELWGQQAFVENKSGANTQVGAEFVARSPADGYTLMVTSEGTFVMNPSLFKKLAYDPENDFVPIARLVDLKQALVVNPSLPVKSVADVIALAKQKPGQFTYGTNGSGSSSHLNMEMLQSMAGVKLTPVHYRGAGQAHTDLIAGRIQMMFVGAGVVAEHHRAGTLKVLAAGSMTRIAEMPEIPTIAESGLAGFDGTSWFGLFAPRATPPEIVRKIHADVRRVFDDKEFQEKFLKPNLIEANVSAPEQTAAIIAEGKVKWGKVIRDANLAE